MILSKIYRFSFCTTCLFLCFRREWQLWYQLIWTKNKLSMLKRALHFWSYFMKSNNRPLFDDIFCRQGLREACPELNVQSSWIASYQFLKREVFNCYHNRIVKALKIVNFRLFSGFDIELGLAKARINKSKKLARHSQNFSQEVEGFINF